MRETCCQHIFWLFQSQVDWAHRGLWVFVCWFCYLLVGLVLVLLVNLLSRALFIFVLFYSQCLSSLVTAVSFTPEMSHLVFADYISPVVHLSLVPSVHDIFCPDYVAHSQSIMSVCVFVSLCLSVFGSF